VVGGDESEEFLRQSALIAQRWPRTVVGAEVVPRRNHMSVLQELADPSTPTHRRALQLLGLT
jgi:arylformamidase